MMSSLAMGAEAPNFAREVRPILSTYCFKCHGQDEDARKAKLRLDVREVATKPAKSGALAIIPGKVDESEAIKRIFSSDPDEVMPPPSAKHPLSPVQQDILQRWVAGGAVYQDHWAFVAPKTVTAPVVKNEAWPRNEIDRFILARLESEGLKPSSEADRAALIRRVSLDLIGLPPSVEEADAFINDASPNAYETLVDRLLASPQYGERWARRWLDLARYADTNGYEKDRTRSMWPWRDWVVRALNADMPFDQFTIQQLAGDMLPSPTEDQLVATGFHRNTMLNEEGGIDPLEFRFRAMTDRVATTGTTWLALTTGCAQCHTHKYDPILHTEYYQLMAFLNNADEPYHYLPSGETAGQRKQKEAEADRLEASLPNHWPVSKPDANWLPIHPTSLITASGEQAKFLPDDSALFAPPGPEKETITLVIDSKFPSIDQIKLEAFTDPSLPSNGPGRVAHGNFVLTEIRITAKPLDGSAPAADVKIISAEANANQVDYPVANAIDGNESTGWAVQEAGKNLHDTKTAVFHFEKPLTHPSGTSFTITLSEQYGTNHTMGRIRLSLPQTTGSNVVKQSESELNASLLDQSYQAWLKASRIKAAFWRAPKPADMKTNSPTLTWQSDESILASGDTTKEDHYELRYATLPAGLTALKLEALPHPSLPDNGPGMAYYEGPRGEFFIGDLSVMAGEQKSKVAASSATAGNAALMGDADLQSGWGGSGQSGQSSTAVLVFEKPWSGGDMVIKFQSGRHYSASLGHFRISFASKLSGMEALVLNSEMEKFLLSPTLTADQEKQLRSAFLMAAPQLAEHVKKIRALRTPPRGQETLVMRERPTSQPRITHLHHRGEYLQPEKVVTAEFPAFLPSLPKDMPRNRLTFAKWLVAPGNPLTARVTVNRAWAAFFGAGLVRTLGDFGFQGELPSHAQLLDWLALHFQKQGWSMKKLHRMLVLSATYRQQSQVTPELQARDPQNRLLARGPRFRVEAEMVRDISLRASGLLSPKMFGPPVHPPQPASVMEAAYGGATWNVSKGEDRYRRALYTFMKRSAPFAATSTFDAPSGEACVARRDLSNSPLQSLTLLNDEAFVETAQALAQRAMELPGDDHARLTLLFRRCLTRFPRDSEQSKLLALLAESRQRLAAGELVAADIATPGQGSPVERAAWTVIARALLNLDETITKS